MARSVLVTGGNRGIGWQVAQAFVALGDGVAMTHQSLGSEDFAWFLEDMPGALVRLGSALPDRSVDLHSALFDIDETALEWGTLIGSAALVELLRRATT